MKKWTRVVILLALVASVWMPSVVLADGGDDEVDVLIQTDGSTDDLVDSIQSLGGTVRFQYQNVPAVAASVPAAQMTAVANLVGVVKVEKDSILHLHDDPELGDDVHRRSFLMEDVSGVEVQAVDLTTVDSLILPEGYISPWQSGAVSAWAETQAGAGTVVAVVDSGVMRNSCLVHAVTGAPGFPQGYNATSDEVPATSFANGLHGTHVAAMIASSCALSFFSPEHPVYLAMAPYLPWGYDFVPVLGQAPAAQIYPVKVVPQGSSGTPTSVVLDGLDHILSTAVH